MVRLPRLLVKANRDGGGQGRAARACCFRRDGAAGQAEQVSRLAYTLTDIQRVLKTKRNSDKLESVWKIPII